MSTVEQAKGAVATVTGSHPVRAWQKYSAARGNVLAGGIAYFAFFSVFPALAAGLSVLGLTMRGVPELRSFVVDNLVTGVGTYLPGLVYEGPKPKGAPGISIDEFLDSSALSWGLVVSLVTLLFTGLGWIDGMRQGIRAVFGEDAGGGNVAVLKLRDLGVLALIGVGVLLSVVAVVASNAAGGLVLGWIGLDGSVLGRVVLVVLGILVALVLDTLTFLVVFRVLPGADVPLRDLLSGAVVGGVGIGVLKQFGATIAGRSADGNAFLGAAASVVVLLVLMNLIGRLVLLAAAWAATNAEAAGTLRAPTTSEVHLGPVFPVEHRQAAERTRERSARAAAARGVVLGVGASALVQLVRAGVRRLGGRRG